MLATLIVIGSQIVFPGGTSQELASTLSRQLDRPVAVMVDPARPKWPAVRIQREKLSDKDVDRLLKAKLNLASFPAKVYGLSTPAWPEFFRSLANRGSYERDAILSAGDGTLEWNVKEETIQARTINGALSLQKALAKFDFPVTYHRMFGGARLVFDTPKTSAESLVKTIAAAVGGKATKKGTGYYIDVDISAYRSRTLEDLRRRSKVDQPVLRAEAEFSIVALQKVPDEILYQAITNETKDGLLYWREAPSEVCAAANRRIYLSTTTINGNSAGEMKLAKWAEKYNLDKPIILVGSGGFGIAYENRRQPGSFLHFM